MSGINTHEELFAELNQDSGFRKEYRKQKPYYDLLREVLNRRKAIGITEAELAKRAGISESYICKIMAAEHNCRLSILVEIAEALDAHLELRILPND